MGQLSNEERNLLSVAYKNSVGSRRAAWRTVSAIQNREAYKGSRHLELINQYRKMIEEELHRICQDVLDLLRDVLIPNSEVAEAKVFYMKMRGDYYRYLCEFTSGEVYVPLRKEQWKLQSIQSFLLLSILLTFVSVFNRRKQVI